MKYQQENQTYFVTLLTRNDLCTTARSRILSVHLHITALLVLVYAISALQKQSIILDIDNMRIFFATLRVRVE